MRFKMSSLMMLLLNCLLLNSICYSQEIAASLLSLNPKGKIFVKPHQQAQWDSSGKIFKFYNGDSIKSGKNCNAIIQYADGLHVRLKPKETHVVGKYLREASFSERLLNAIKSLVRYETSQLLHGGARGNTYPPVLIYPRFGKVLSTTPSFEWLASDSSATYWVKVFEDTVGLCKVGGEELWYRTTKDTVFKFPPDVGALKHGKKYWVDIGRKTSVFYEDHGCFAVATDEEKTAIDSLEMEIRRSFVREETTEKIAASILFAALLLQEKYLTDALIILRRALAKQPANLTIQAMLQRIYTEAGPTVLLKKQTRE